MDCHGQTTSQEMEFSGSRRGRFPEGILKPTHGRTTIVCNSGKMTIPVALGMSEREVVFGSSLLEAEVVVI